MAAVSQRLVYSEDVVQHPTKRGVIGVVLQNAESSDEEYSSSDEEEQLEKGHCIVAWYPKGTEEEIEESKLKILDRSLLPGDVVCWADPQKPQQKGYIKSVQVKVDLKVTGTNYVISGADSQQLTPLQDLSAGLVVADGPWMGIIQDVYFSLVLRLKNGSRCAVEGEQVNTLVDITDQREEDSPFYCFGFYPGQRVYGPARLFREGQWLSGARPVLGNSQRVKAVVEEASVSEVTVDWQVCGYVGHLTEQSPDTPAATFVGDDIARLKPLNYFREASIQVGDKAFYFPTEEDVANYWQHVSRNKGAANASESDRQLAPSSQDSAANVEDATLDGKGSERKALYEDVNGYGVQDLAATRDQTLTSSDGSGDDDDREDVSNSPSVHVASRRNDGRHGQALTSNRGLQGRRRRQVRRKKRRPAPIKVAVGERICCEVNKTKTLVHIVWQDGTEEENVASIEVVPVLHLDELEFFCGDFVVDKRGTASRDSLGVVQSANSRDRTCNVLWLKSDGTESTEKEKFEALSVYDVADHTDYTFRPGDCVVQLEGAVSHRSFETEEEALKNPGVIGQVIHVTTEGKVQVIWSDGYVTCVPCHHIFVAHREDDEDEDGSSDGSSEDDSDEWETLSETEEEEDEDEEDEIENELDPLEGVIMRSLAALGSHASGQRTTDDYQMDEHPPAPTDGITPQDVESPADILSPSEGLEGEVQLGPQSENFAVLECAHSSHHYFGQTLMPTNARQFSSVVRRELNLLRSSVPAGIHIRAYEDRLDLFSILIEGPPGTPYEGGLFAFDLQLSADYPRSPPSVYFISYCSGRLNPNLYEDGKVCVSLLGTWNGRGTETWTGKSNLCQVVLSLQGLILCEEPYYNEAGYEKHKGTKEGKENSRMYNEMVVIKLLQSMEGMLRNPPSAFKEQVTAHLLATLPRLMKDFRQWIDSCGTEGSAEVTSYPSLEYPLFPLSRGFCISLKRTLDRLEIVLQESRP